jgi:hypothetical protein
MLVSDGSKTWRLEQGRRRLLSSPAARTSWAKGRASVAALPGDLALPDGAPLGPAEGTLLRLPDGGGAVVSGDRLRPMAASVASTLGYAVSVAPPATATDLAVVAAGDPITSLTRHPSGALVKSSTGYWQIDQGRRRRVHDSLVAHDARKVLPAKAGDLALAAATLSAPSGFASVGSDGVVRLVSDGRLVPLDAQQATDLGYAGRDLPVLPASSLGQLPPGSLLTTASHVSGSLVSSPDGTWLLEGGSRRPVPASVLATFRGRVVLPATAEDLALPLATIASPPHGTLIRSDNGSRWVVDQGWRRWISPTVSARLGLESMAWLFVPVVDLAGTPAGAPVL